MKISNVELENLKNAQCPCTFFLTNKFIGDDTDILYFQYIESYNTQAVNGILTNGKPFSLQLSCVFGYCSDYRVWEELKRK